MMIDLVDHWSHLGRWPKGSLVEDSGTLRYETPMAHLPYRQAGGARPRRRERPHATSVEKARNLGCRRVVLHSSEMAVGLYARAGFVERCPLGVYATTDVWSGRGH